MAVMERIGMKRHDDFDDRHLGRPSAAAALPVPLTRVEWQQV